eukprot:CAMPEP_0177599656 /NCGR_PEP_ID=MMETSP0419_2-20121207/13120_1 /TAXON_ID=582737 /ORGANISM="Tetraselmis sp., Strain GSL018" /LENGTH=422 /DNA_ID=CAMNT_0019092425 /DNA_START=487 /DNA_END=1756 /DNA_ORIENTATION=+
MKPHRLCMTHHLVLGYGIHENLDVFRPRAVYPVELAQFHAEDYVDFLSRVTPDMMSENMQLLQRFNLQEDCPVFEGVFDFCRKYTGASIDGCVKLNHGLVDTAINWAGGLHHAKRSEASGFCYINDLVLAVLELLKYHARVLYIDIDIHHGDGVEEAFYLTDRVMTVSFHKYGDFFFPGTGSIKDIGEYRGKNYSVNVPLNDGCDDETFLALFKPIMAKVMEMFQPGAVVLQCGADSLQHDRLGCFNLSIQGHADAVAYMKSFRVPMLVTGGGGYTKSNVARCWTKETAVLAGTEIPDDLPKCSYYEYFGPNFSLHKLTEATYREYIDNKNTPEYVESIKQEVFQNLSRLDAAPAVQMHEVPPDSAIPEFDDEDEEDDPDERLTQYAKDHMIIKDDLIEVPAIRYDNSQTGSTRQAADDRPP